MQGVLRNLQILLEQSKLWKGELAKANPRSAAGIIPRRISRGDYFFLVKSRRDGLGKFYG
jgi:hypothetical protein